MKLQDIGIHYGNQTVLAQVNYQFDATGLYVILGNNGSGKTSLLKTMCGLMPAFNGAILIENQSVANMSLMEKSTHFAYADHPFPLPDYIQLNEYLELGIANQNLDYATVLSMFGIETIAEKHVVKLSRGQQQKAMLAKIFYQNKPIWLLDEPSNYLDYPSIQQFWKLIKEKAKSHLIICTVHNPQEAIDAQAQCLVIKDKALIALPKSSSFEEIISYL